MQRTGLWVATRRSLAAGLAAGAALFLFPMLLGLGGAAEGPAVLPASPTPFRESPSPTPSPDATPSPSGSPGPDRDRELTVRVLGKDGTVQTMTMEDYLWSVTAAEMPATFEGEALRAQAVCARTYALWRVQHPGKHEGADLCTDSGCCQAYITREDAAERWGPLAENWAEKIRLAVADTAGTVVLYDGQPIQAVFFSSSGGRTDDAETVWGRALPYLTSVDSPEGEEVPNYHSTVTLTAAQVKALAETACPGSDLSGPASEWFSRPVLAPSGRVETIQLGGATLSGGAARNLFGLRSAWFTVAWDGERFVFSVTGHGHGVGLSQYGANAMAKAGSSWQEILSHYYTGVTLGQGW